MYDPDLYDSFSEFQRRDASELIPYMVSNMSWKRSETVLDFGCGSGFNTKNILLPSMESSLKDDTRQIYAIDISKKMIDFASVKYTHPTITYMMADIMKDDCEFPCKFDKIFSLHVLHWIADQGKAFQILFNLLKNNGEIGFYFIGKAAVFSVYDNMSKHPVWAGYLTDVKNFIPKTFNCADPAKYTLALMRSIGFYVHEANVITRNYRFHSVDTMIDAAMAANPFIHRIPVEMQNDYREDFRNEFLPFLNFVPTPESPSAVEVPYQLVFVRGQKPSD